MSNLPQNPVLICGDGCAKMADMETKPGVIRTRGNNSCDLLLGRERSLELSHEGVFSLLPEWGPRWRGIFSRNLGLNRVNAACSMRNRHRNLARLDTGIAGTPAGLHRGSSAEARIRG